MSEAEAHTKPLKIGPIARFVGALGAGFIQLLIVTLGRRHRASDIAWLAGPCGGPVIGDTPYAEVAARERLSMDRSSRDAGLLANFTDLDGAGFDASAVHPAVREFYERTGAFAMDVWSTTYFPSNIVVALMVLTMSRQFGQLNFPLSPLETAEGISSEIIVFRRSDGSVRYTGWFRTIGRERHVLYAGFYMVERAPIGGAPCVKVVFPMPHGNAVVMLRPRCGADGALILESSSRRFGEAGFYRVDAPQGFGADARARVWHVRTLNERFHVYVDERGVLRCDHSVRYLGLPVLRLRYKMYRRRDDATVD